MKEVAAKYPDVSFCIVDSAVEGKNVASLVFAENEASYLGRNNPTGIAFAALLWAWLDKASPELDFHDYDKEIAVIMQGLIVLSAVVSYEAVREGGLRRQQRRVGAELAAGHVLGATSDNMTEKEVAGR